MEKLIGNKLLALFEMDFDIIQISRPSSITFSYSKDGHSTWNFIDMRYHFSFDWQFKILEKIAKLGFDYSIAHNYCRIGSSNKLIALYHDRMPIGSVTTTKDAIFRACVKFVNWYVKEKDIKLPVNSANLTLIP